MRHMSYSPHQSEMPSKQPASDKDGVSLAKDEELFPLTFYHDTRHFALGGFLCLKLKKGGKVGKCASAPLGVLTRDVSEISRYM